MITSRTSTQASRLAETIRIRIQSEHLDDGTFFMTEADLAAEYGVSRAVAREAVGQLQALGILEGRKRKGLIVRHPDPLLLFSNSLPSLVRAERDWKELELLRYVIEVGAIDLAVRSATEEQIEQLSEIMDRLEAALRIDPCSEDSVRLDMEFHLLVLQMTGSRLVAGMQEVLVKFFQIAPVDTDVGPQPGERIIWEHRELLNAIRCRDVERARSMIRMQFLFGVPPAGAK
ncbi:FadR/GntR family transcriptional regulator [Planctomicrobium sp. SH661]|uniref:FadR/GntR family transcriptional regulator n=1 Tax=Planctomicrobium sp. SH661 TaxID=3448124 RepID=UPI003F5CAC25